MKKRKPNAGWFRKGFDPRRSRGAAGPGRKPDPWYALMRRTRSRKHLLRTVRRVINDTEHPAWWGCYKWVVAQGYGKPKRRIVARAQADISELIAERGA